MAEQQQHQNRAFYLDRSSLQCKAGCGFFGNPEWFGYCSICFKQHQQYINQQSRHPSQGNQAEQRLHFIQQRQQQQQQGLPPYYHLGGRRLQDLQQQIQSITKSVHRNEILIASSPQAINHTNTGQRDSDLRGHQQQDTRTGLSTSTNYQVINSPAGCGPAGSPSMAAVSAVSPAADLHSVTSPNSSLLLRSNSFLGSITSPTSLVQMGYETISNLSNTLVGSAVSSFRASPSTSSDGTITGDTGSIQSSSQSEYSSSRPKNRKQWTSIINPSISSRKNSTDQPLSFHYDMAWVDCLNNTNKFARELLAVETKPDKTINDLSELVQEFYKRMLQRFDTQLIYKGATGDQLELLNDNMERILNEQIYHVISARIINEDEDHNMAVMKRIRSMNWVTLEHLEIDIDFQRPVVHDLLDKAICQMVEMNSRTSSIDKLDCIVQCSKTIFELLQEGPSQSESGNSVPVSADQFFPVLVFVVIQANPPMLPADMKYLTRFSNQSRLLSGETAYYFTNLCGALEFIKKANGALLNISEDDFNKYMNGEAVPETKSQFHTYLCDGLRTMCSNDAALKKLQSCQESRSSKMDNLIEQIDVHLEINRAKLREIQLFSENLDARLKSTQPSLMEINEKYFLSKPTGSEHS